MAALVIGKGSEAGGDGGGGLRDESKTAGKNQEQKGIYSFLLLEFFFEGNTDLLAILSPN